MNRGSEAPPLERSGKGAARSLCLLTVHGVGILLDGRTDRFRLHQAADQRAELLCLGRRRIRPQHLFEETLRMGDGSDADRALESGFQIVERPGRRRRSADCAAFGHFRLRLAAARCFAGTLVPLQDHRRPVAPPRDLSRVEHEWIRRGNLACNFRIRASGLTLRRDSAGVVWRALTGTSFARAFAVGRGGTDRRDVPSMPSSRGRCRRRRCGAVALSSRHTRWLHVGRRARRRDVGTRGIIHRRVDPRFSPTASRTARPSRR